MGDKTQRNLHQKPAETGAVYNVHMCANVQIVYKGHALKYDLQQGHALKYDLQQGLPRNLKIIIKCFKKKN